MEQKFTKYQLNAVLQGQFAECSRSLKHIISNLYKLKPLAIATDNRKAVQGITQLISYLNLIDDETRAIGDLPSNEEVQRTLDSMTFDEGKKYLSDIDY